MVPARRRKPSPSSPRRKAASPPPPSPGPDDLRGELREALGLPPTPPRKSKGAELVLRNEGHAAPRKPRRPVDPEDLLPTGHLVCEACGRIARWPLPSLTQLNLSELAAAPPEHWEVRTLSVSFAGYCPRCRSP